MIIDPKTYTLTHIKELTDTSLIDYMSEWGIPSTTSRKYLKEVKLYNQEVQKHFLTVGMLNEEEGYELYSSEISDYWIGERDISFIRGLQMKPANIHVFFDMKDFLAVVSCQNDEAFIDDAIVLHTTDQLYKVPPYLYQYHYKSLFSWMPNNSGGNLARVKLSAFCAAEPGLQHRPQNQLYHEHEYAINFHNCKNRLTL